MNKPTAALLRQWALQIGAKQQYPVSVRTLKKRWTALSAPERTVLRHRLEADLREAKKDAVKAAMNIARKDKLHAQAIAAGQMTTADIVPDPIAEGAKL